MNSNNSKSTPLSQLPSPQQAPNSQFVNEQHRQIVAQAQVAAQNFTMPQTTSGGVSSTEDADIQEALALVTGAVPASSEAQGPQQQQGPILTGAVCATAAARLVKTPYVSGAHRAADTARHCPSRFRIPPLP